VLSPPPPPLSTPPPLPPPLMPPLPPLPPPPPPSPPLQLFELLRRLPFLKEAPDPPLVLANSLCTLSAHARGARIVTEGATGAGASAMHLLTSGRCAVLCTVPAPPQPKVGGGCH
jgi:hypothetical protein